ncbi:hypothetical protein [Rathayibacter sp. AY1C5]|uniref:hypothetical protein n=1 Tax=Rathayibacter sp. AY1C5 TaxID=2080538 RepID=UPI0011B03EAE|nr:hypothetical protein [Rathayibacter sp. AY1C5]
MTEQAGPPQSPRAKVPAGAREDEPSGTGSVAQGQYKQVSDPEAKHRRAMDLSKLRFAFWLVGLSLVALLGLEIADSYVPAPEGAGDLSGAADVFKLIATTALGFIFGRSLGRGES